MPQQTFWDHLDVLRSVVVRILLVTVGCAVVAFMFKDPLFSVVLAPKSPDFITYRFLEEASASVGVPFDSSFSVQLINTGLAQQFLIHMKTALCAGFLCAFPYILYQLF